MPPVGLTWAALVLGILHGLGADHLMAVVALSTTSREAGGRWRALRVAARFAIGHAALLTTGAAVGGVFGWQVPALVEHGGELIAGGLLMALGVAGLWAVRAGRVYGHAHPHGSPPHVHWHLHVGRPGGHAASSGHSHAATLFGAVFAVSGLRALTLMAPAGGAAGASGLPLAGVVLAFAVGILLSMCLFGVLLAHLMATPAVARLGRLSAAASAVGSIGLGTYWILSRGL